MTTTNDRFAVRLMPKAARVTEMMNTLYHAWGRPGKEDSNRDSLDLAQEAVAQAWMQGGDDAASEVFAVEYREARKVREVKPPSPKKEPAELRARK